MGTDRVVEIRPPFLLIGSHGLRDVRQCQGVVLADWIARGPDGAERGSGTNVFQLGPDAKLTAVTGLWR